MSKGFPSIGRKPSPANPGNYARDFSRRIKDKNHRRRKGSWRSEVKLNTSSKPFPVELTKPDTSVKGFENLGIVFLICLVIFAALIWLG